MQIAQHGMLGFPGLLRPETPPSYAVASWSSAFSDTPARQTSLEPGSGGVDAPMSWSMWVNIANVNINTTQTFLTNCNPAIVAQQQYALQLVGYASSTFNQCIAFAIFNSAGTENIQVLSSVRFNRSRWVHLVVTYDGSETAAGLNLYFNGVKDTSATHSTSGAYTGLGSQTTYRFGINAANSTRRVAGKMRDLAVWNAELTQGEVDTLFNLGVPMDVNSVASFYGTKIIGYWPLRSNVQCLNNSALNLNSGLSFQSVPINTTYGDTSMYNAVPGNTRYIAFGRMFAVNNRFMWIGRSGTDHLTGGKIVQFMFDKGLPMSNNNPPTDIIPFVTEDYRTGTAGVVNGNIQVDIIRETNGVGTVLGNSMYTSTDGLTGQTYGSAVAITTPVTAFATYSKIHPSYTAGEYNCIAYALNGSNWELYFGTFASGAWTWGSPFYSATSPQLNETALVKCGNNTWLALIRSSDTAFIYQSVSTNGGSTWSAPTATNLAVTAAANMCDATVTGDGSRIAVIYTDKGNDLVYLSLQNSIATILASPTSYNSGSAIWQTYSGSPQFLVGYPSIVADPADPHYAAVAVSGEFSSTRADLMFGYGIVDLL